MTRCVNCGAPLSGYECKYCGTKFGLNFSQPQIQPPSINMSNVSFNNMNNLQIVCHAFSSTMEMKPSIKKQALNHYDTMIKIVSSWEEVIKATIKPYPHVGVDWYGDKCSYCKKYNRSFTKELFESDCGECQLTKKTKA